ncbi:putative DNA polymerase delta subunit 4 [Rosellinia necatrix]|uniref:Putative DNA polymerase delta subunit 4 n=1 Tax=Rosellinia necatrix TaxID=77044 RepID=A0A1W2TRG1_ROSNE|nr:putative DNA polymerase delta subunit 4 [Rosellinia necatrix]
MPATTRRSSGGGRPAGRQATLSFNHRVTKSSVPKSIKDITSAPAATSPLAKHVVHAELEPDVKAEADSDAEEEEEEEKAQAEEAQQPAAEPVREKTEAELRAGEVTSRQIAQYWRGIEGERRTRRLHQEDLGLAEKILRYWDVSSQYGPCVGVSRLRRWQRADRLGLNPPVEVLAVLMQEEEKGVKSAETAHMDDILNSVAVGAV